MLRFSLTTFLAVVCFVAFGCAALVESNPLWLKMTATLTLGVLTVSILLAAAMQTAGRWFWFGLTVAGWIYLAIVFYGEKHEFRDLMLTKTALDAVHEGLGIGDYTRTPEGHRVLLHEARERVYVSDRSGAVVNQMNSDEAKAAGLLQYAYDSETSPSPVHFYRVGHFLWALVLGGAAGMLTYVVRLRTADRG